ncbi:MAG: DNA-protecting protein DprA [Cyanobacteria bacterium QS_7_48_42]|nr:MAG: DNA-protecting protein DprA [Cyanobacteria bacterium QH_10_48_56]PSO66727.1 MAG: DNA-protecting protein DprA [Cyanobacteria bacterium QH_2_48_84]PSO69029.1 MAG: DNA-protecting protein DprA [Cyanobacteria bacterium QH_6_48_35]PSO74622.1 MAG: DNA-protecting protein DprA [Cyanobacteria bacterium QH_3_48_40]PSO80834.1 MAG: DNA-protecting protein DprA [Cyanobacteria bacterium QH_9_48_43]PSP01296.1 MAG: DNA-protecting protein DprA [Cyanobacteria bacterium QS_7_48_42]PSP06716.1 MAG: DNA-prot
MVEERAYWLAWSQITGVGAVLLRRVQQHFGTLEAAWEAPAQALGEVEGIGGRLVEAVAQGRSQLHPEELLEQHCAKNPHFWTPADAEYPRLLLEIPSPPPVLYYCGEINRQENLGSTPLVTIVGTRYPTDYGRRWTRKISAALAQHGFTVVSGMATGIDAEAHRGCLEAGGRTWAVMGTGLDLVYPASHSKLAQDIQKQGLVLSEYPVGTKPERGHFPVRNRIIAGLSRAVLIAEAPQKSGALITARYANEFCRDVYALPGSLDNEQSLGCLGLLNRGANLVLSEGHLLEMLGTMPQLDVVEQSPQPPELEPELAQVLQAITVEPTSFDLIVQQVGLSASSVSGILLQLELLGLVSQLPGMRYKRADS